MTIKKQEKLFRDPIHNVIHFDKQNASENLICKLIDTTAVQRLRRIQQLGLASYIYPGAEHSRFGHSLGTACMARKLFDSATHKCGDEFERCITLCAALLHDIGHSPFSHAFEASLAGIFPFEHEELTEEIILWEDGEIFQILSEFDGSLPQRIANCIAHRDPQWYHNIISSQLDADRMDYILRDGFMTGVRNYMYDSDRIIEMLDHDERGPIVGARAVQAVESYLLSRFHMYQQVYHHKTVRGAEKLIEAIFKRIADLYQIGDKSALSAGSIGTMLENILSQSKIELHNYISVHDAHAWVAFDTWAQHKDPILSDLSQRLLKRQFYKTLEIPNNCLSMYPSVVSDLTSIMEHNKFDAHYYLTLDTTSNKAFAPYAPPQTPSLPFLEMQNNKQTFVNNDDIRILMSDDRILSIQDASPIVQMLTKVQYSTMRICFPEEVRDEVTKLLHKKHLILY